MYSFSQHPLVGEVQDEPLYGRHLLLNPHLARPYKAELLKSQPQSSSLDACYDILTASSPNPAKPVRFLKVRSQLRSEATS